ncbi:MAG: response regulator transcription factor [Oscillospiraceae bacterium]|nr:response regulator transcription factor [Oscillospiraceae bacterium]
MKKILVIEDDMQICDVIRIYFQDEGAECVFVHDGNATMELIDSGLEDIGLVLLDIMLPHTDGFAICRRLRKNYDFPILFITARGREEDILRGYQLGCDDYIVKPFSLAQLYAKCMAFLRRSEGRVLSEQLRVGSITLDPNTLQCFADGKEVELPPKEYAILRYLLEHKQQVVTRDTLLNQVWGYDYFGNDRVVDDRIRVLRKALGNAGKQIKTVIGSGYKLTD